ncbi:hypothetical protein CKO28_23340 [Rhodovibrio sodomensis]|uniref:ABC-type glycine betaine transport system substrate-binding domain-containing protein n=1 Tax=Rhodovibrio sodomensis TaxID=1088 RepID=A0ABS1DKB0_9PROT|nr:glycine betaine ABC transporter substrate-binding protein [Rhodovibrio sodomensis]MBK1670950.1 hypothetical protein [Rhodovibrio sodomensis]
MKALLPRAGRAIAVAAALAAMPGAFAATGGWAQTRDQDEIAIGVPPWPGVAVKSQVVAQILDAIGYPARIEARSLTQVYRGIAEGDLDVTLGAWMPAQRSMLRPLLKTGRAEQLAVNLDGAVQGLAVPAYVCHDGIQSVDDLAAHGARFDRRIHAIDAGAAMTQAFEDAIADDDHGLGGWQVVPGSTAGMLSRVAQAIRNRQAIVFHGWKPHWMNVRFQICLLSDDAGGGIADVASTVWTVTARGWADDNAGAARFLRQLQPTSAVQSRWIYEHVYRDRDAEDVARSWIIEQTGQVEIWLDGVRAANGRPAIQAVRAAIGG